MRRVFALSLAFAATALPSTAFAQATMATIGRDLRTVCERAYEAGACITAIEAAIVAAQPLLDQDKTLIYSQIRSYKKRHPELVERIDPILIANNIILRDPACPCEGL